MTCLLQQNISAASADEKKVPAVGFEPPVLGFFAAAPDTIDAGRVILGGGFAGVAENNRGKIRV